MRTTLSTGEHRAGLALSARAVVCPPVSEVASNVGLTVDDFEVLKGVIGAHPVLVVDMLAGGEFSPQVRLHDGAVLKNVVSIAADVDVAVSGNPAPATPVRMVLHRHVHAASSVEVGISWGVPKRPVLGCCQSVRDAQVAVRHMDVGDGPAQSALDGKLHTLAPLGNANYYSIVLSGVAI